MGTGEVDIPVCIIKQVHTRVKGSLPNEEGVGRLHTNSQHPLAKETN